MSTQKSLKKFEKIYRETYNNTLKYIICKCDNLNNVDDIVQETYLELYKVIEAHREILNYQAYIINIARNKIIKYFNDEKKLSTISIYREIDEQEFTIDLEANINIESEFIVKDNVKQIWKYIKSVDDEIAKIFYLHFIMDMTFKEISEELEINESTVKSRLYGMLKNIKKLNIGGEQDEKKCKRIF